MVNILSTLHFAVHLLAVKFEVFDMVKRTF